MAYVLPQVQVFQMFNVLPTSTVRHLNAFVFGPNYQLFRYANASEKELISVGSYDKSTDTAIVYPNQPAGSTIDQAYAQLYMENVWAKYLAISASAASPLFVVSDAEMNKVRAVPVIGTPVNFATASAQIGQIGGTYSGDVVAPVVYAIAPYGGTDVGGDWSDNSTGDADPADLASTSEVGVYQYMASNGLHGTVDIPANALTANVTVQGPDGLVLDVDSGLSNSLLREPLQIKISDAPGTAYFILGINPAHLNDFADWALDSAKPLQINVTIAAGTANVVSWSATNKRLTLTIDGMSLGYGPSTLAELKTALDANPDVAEYFTVGDITGTDSNSVAKANTFALTPVDVDTGVSVNMVPDVVRVRVTPNPYVFQTANGVSRSSQFKSRDVQIGDRVSYSIVDGSTVTHTGTSKVVSLAADITVPLVDMATQNTTNTATQVGTDLSPAAAIVMAGVDNQRAMDGASTGVIPLSASNLFYPGELDTGIIEDTFTVTVVVQGVKGVAMADVSNASGTYRRTNVPIEAKGTDGEIYVGRNLVINFDQGGSDPDAIFQVGDTYTFTIKAPFSKLASRLFNAGGTYAGPVNTTYMVEVVRGGVFTRSVTATVGLQFPVTPPTLTPGVDWASWTGGDVADEYVLKCTTGGNIAAAEFELTSQTGDDASNINFGTVTTDVTLGNKGLYAQFSADDTFTIGDYWIIRVNACRPQVRVYDTAGVDAGSYVVVEDATPINLGNYGADLTFDKNVNTEGGFVADGGLLMGDIYMVDATAANAGAVRTLVLADDLPSAITPSSTGGVFALAPNRAAVNLFILQAVNTVSSEKVQSPPDYNWVAGTSDVVVYGGIAVQDSTWYENDGSQPFLPVETADMYLQYRALLSTYASTIQEITDVGDIAPRLGTVTPENPLAQGVYNALINSGDRSVFYMAVPTNDLAGYTYVLDRASLTKDVYGFAPLTTDRTILAAVEGHINDMSSEENKAWRYGFFGTTMPTEASVYDLLKNPGHEEYFATVTVNPSIAGSYTIVKFFDAAGDPSPYTQVLHDVKVGDKVRIKFATDAWGNATYATYTVGALLTNTSLRLVSGPASALATQTKVEVWHDLSVTEMAAAVAAISTAFANRRIAHVFPSQLGAFGVIESAEFGAAAVAGLNSSVPPQQGLTNIELNGFDDLPMVYSTFSRSQLNTMAGAGTLIIMQDVAGGAIYIRHQVTTATSQGNLNTTELSITKNLDSISYYFADRLAPFIGRYNVTPDLLVVLAAQIEDGLRYLGSFTNVSLLGPQLLLAGTKLDRLEQHPTLRDHVVAVVSLQLPYPLNVLQLYLVV